MRDEQRLAKRGAEFRLFAFEPRALSSRVFVDADGEHTPDERVAVRVEPARWQREQRVTGLDGRAIDDGALLDGSDDEADEVEVAGRVHVRHVRRLAADQRAAGVFTRVRDALHKRLFLIEAERR